MPKKQSKLKCISNLSSVDLHHILSIAESMRSCNFHQSENSTLKALNNFNVSKQKPTLKNIVGILCLAETQCKTQCPNIAPAKGHMLWETQVG